jgi:hypothetical protein
MVIHKLHNSKQKWLTYDGRTWFVGSSAWLDSVYSILVNIGGASESMRGSFVQNHTDAEYPCTEWRFCGHLGYGGKYLSKTNRVDCYIEEETPKRLALIGELNEALAKLSNGKAQR